MTSTIYYMYLLKLSHPLMQHNRNLKFDLETYAIMFTTVIRSHMRGKIFNQL